MKYFWQIERSVTGKVDNELGYASRREGWVSIAPDDHPKKYTFANHSKAEAAIKRISREDLPGIALRLFNVSTGFQAGSQWLNGEEVQERVKIDWERR